jgi:hypothetical protein
MKKVPLRSKEGKQIGWAYVDEETGNVTGEITDPTCRKKIESFKGKVSIIHPLGGVRHDE